MKTIDVRCDGRTVSVAVRPNWTLRTVRARALSKLGMSGGEEWSIICHAVEVSPDERIETVGSDMLLKRRTPEQVNVVRRERLPDERKSITQRLQIGRSATEGGPIKCFITVGLYDDGRPGEVFIRIGKEGGVLGTVMDQWAIAMSVGLQYGIPLDVFLQKAEFVQSEGGGMVSGCAHLVRMCQSPVDCVARYLRARFLPEPTECIAWPDTSGIAF